MLERNQEMLACKPHEHIAHEVRLLQARFGSLIHEPVRCSFQVAASTQVRVISLAKGPREGGPRPPGVQRPFNRCWLHERRKPSIWTSSKAAEREGQAPRRILRKLPALPASRDEKWTGWLRLRLRLRLPQVRCSGDCQHPCPSTSRRSGLLGMPGALGGEAYEK